jgi:hypothetical protein
MAFNWDRLCKAQRDYTKPKFALDAIAKHLKKRPKDPYVLVSISASVCNRGTNYHRPGERLSCSYKISTLDQLRVTC